MNELIIPNHVGIIMDGNGRWAKERGQIRSFGHKKGAENLKKLCVYMKDKGVKYISLYAFSTENFKREQKEVDFLMNLFMKVFNNEKDFIIENKIRVLFSGRKDPLPKSVLDSMDKIMEETKDFTEATMNICLNYGSVYEVVDTTKKLCEMYKNGSIELEDITPEFFQKNLYQDLPPLDFVIRTSGELRLSNFMMYQASYAEFYFPNVYFPDFDEKEFDKALDVFNHRDRRFGGINNER